MILGIDKITGLSVCAYSKMCAGKGIGCEYNS